MSEQVEQAVCQACLDGDVALLKALLAEANITDKEKGKQLFSACATVRVAPEMDAEARKKGNHVSVSRKQQVEEGTEHAEGALFTPGFDTYMLRTKESANTAGCAGPCKTSSSVQYAAFGGHLDVLKFLIEEWGVDPKLHGQFKWSAVSIAGCRRFIEVSDWLKSKGA